MGYYQYDLNKHFRLLFDVAEVIKVQSVYSRIDLIKLHQLTSVVVIDVIKVPDFIHVMFIKIDALGAK